jgi:magnesium transporter
MTDVAQKTTDEEFEQLHPADLADRLQRLPDDEVELLIEQLPADRAAATLPEIEEDKLPSLLRQFTTAQLTEFFRRLPPDSIADLLQQLSPARRRDVLAAMPAEVSTGVRALLAYPEESAGGIMTNRFIALREDMTVEQARQTVAARAEQQPAQDIAYLYVTDAARHLRGIISLRDLVFRPGQRQVGDIMNRDVKHVLVTDDQEELAGMFDRYHYLGLPVLDTEGKLVGVVRASDALEIARKEATEDMQLMVGLSGEERALTPWATSLRRRLPWLYINLATAFLAAFVVGIFESTIASWTALAIFLPIVAGQGGNAGMQTLTVIIRDLALGEVTLADGWKVLFKEALLGLANGIAIGVVVGLIGWWWKDSALLGVVAGAAMVLNQFAAGLAGVAIPFGLKLLRVDPALASSIFLTTVTDVAGFFFFLGLAALALGMM